MTTFPTRTTGTTAGRPPRTSAARPASAWAFAGVAVTSFGGPLAETSLAVEFTGAVVLMVAAVIVLVASLANRRSQGQSF